MNPLDENEVARAHQLEEEENVEYDLSLLMRLLIYR
jgi:hypothetical protein